MWVLSDWALKEPELSLGALWPWFCAGLIPNWIPNWEEWSFTWHLTNAAAQGGQRYSSGRKKISVRLLYIQESSSLQIISHLSLINNMRYCQLISTCKWAAVPAKERKKTPFCLKDKITELQLKSCFLGGKGGKKKTKCIIVAGYHFQSSSKKKKCSPCINKI